MRKKFSKIIGKALYIREARDIAKEREDYLKGYLYLYAKNGRIIASLHVADLYDADGNCFDFD